MSRGKKWAQFEKENKPSDWNSETKILMTGGLGCDILVHKGILKDSKF